MVRINAEWALWSELPGAREDYGVLACSDGRLSRGAFTQILTRNSPGTPDTEGALPRLTMSGVRVSGVWYVGFALQAESRKLDGVGRKIYPTRFFCLPYEELRAQPVSYRSIFTAFDEILLPESTGTPITVNVDPFNAKAIAADLDLLGEQTVRTAATLLLNRAARVCVNQSEHTSLIERLRFLDAVTALLPYGYRAKLTATTWANSAMTHKLRLFFGRNARGVDVKLLPWMGATEIPYQHMGHFTVLAKLIDEYGSAAVVRELAADTEARSFTEPEHAVQALPRIDAALALRKRLRGGRPKLGDIREFFTRSRDSDVAGIGEEDDDHDALRLLLHLVENGNAQDLGHVVEQIPRLSFDELQQLIDPLLDMARRLLWAQTGVRLQGLVRRLSMSPDPSAADRFVSGLINPPPTEPAALEGGLSAAAGLLMETLIHQPTAYPRTAVALSANVPVTLEVLVQLSGSEEQAALVAGPQQVWPHLPPVLLHALQVSAAQKRDTVRHAEFEEYARYGRCCVRALLEISANQGRLSRAMEGFLDWLYAERGFHDAGTYWSGKLSGLVTDEPGLMGILDALLLMTGAGLKWMTQVPPEGWQAYQDGFVHTWRLDWPSIESMKSRLAEHLGNVRWDGYDDRADNVLVLLGKLFPDGDLAVYQALEYGLAASSDLSRSPRAERWLADRRAGCAQPPLSQHRKPAHPRGQSDEAKAIAPSTPAVPEQPRQVDSTTTAIIRAADYIGQALNRGDSWEQISDALTKGGCFNDHLIAAGIIERLPGIVAPHRPLNLGRQWASQLMEELCGGQCGPEPAQKLIRHYLREIADDLSHRLDQLEMIEKATNGDWHAAEVPLLNELQERIESLGALAKPKQKGGLRIPRPRLIRSSRSGDDPG